MKTERMMECIFLTQANIKTHLHLDIEIIYVLDGKICLKCEGENEIELEKDGFALINSNVRHEYIGKDNVLTASLFIDYIALCDFFNGYPVSFVCELEKGTEENKAKVRYLIQQLIHYDKEQEMNQVMLKKSLEFELLYILISYFHDKNEVEHYDVKEKNDRLNAIMQYLMMNYKKHIALKDLAEHMHLSPTYIAKYLKKNMGITFLKLLNNIRLEHTTSELKNTEKSIIRIAMDNGFPNIAGFNRAFREMYNKTPSEYREIFEKNRQEYKVKDIYEQKQLMFPVPKDVKKEQSKFLAQAQGDFLKRESYRPIWNKLINGGSAIELVRAEFCAKILSLKKELGFTYIRLWNLFSEEVLIYVDEQDKIHYNFAVLDNIFDFFVQNGIRPYIELSYKPKGVYKNSADWVNTELPGKKVSHSVLKKNKKFLQEFVEHLAVRYGKKELANWYIELESNVKQDKQYTNVAENETWAEYFSLFEMIYTVFKQSVPQIKVGGAGFELDMNMEHFSEVIEEWKSRSITPDMISVYCYHMDNCGYQILDASPEQNLIKKRIELIRNKLSKYGFSDTEFHITEWNITRSERNVLNDNYFRSAYFIKNYLEIVNIVDMAGISKAMDDSSIDEQSKNLLYGGLGIITRDGITKPVYYALQYLRFAENFIIGRSENAIITSNGQSEILIICHNYQNLKINFLDENNTIMVQQQLLENELYLDLQIHLKNMEDGQYRIKTYSANREYGNIQTIWQEIGHDIDYQYDEVEFIQSTIKPKLRIFHKEVENGELRLRIHMAPQEITNVSIMKLQ